MSVLRVENITKRFAGLMALDKVSFETQNGSIQGIIGPNGAGKTTLFQIISGVLKPSNGAIYYNDKSITHQEPHINCAQGIARTFQSIRLFSGMTVLENVMTGMHTHLKSGLFMSGFRLPSVRREEAKTRQKALDILEFVGIKDNADLEAISLPYGQQRLVEISRALASEPKLLILDEPAAGMNHTEGKALAAKIIQIQKTGVTILLVEHDMGLVMEICDQIIVLNYGVVIAQGDPLSIQNNSEVIEAYLGKKDNDA